MNKKYIFTFLLLITATAVFAQNRLSHSNNIGWVTTTITPAISKKLSGHIEYQWRRADWGNEWQQSLLRTGLNYKFNPQATAHIGYAWILTYPYGDYTIAAVGKPFPEHRVYEQLVMTGAVGKVSFTHRIRLEQRWLGKLYTMNSDQPDEWVYLNRARYMCRADVPVYKMIYAAAYDEILIGFGKNVGENIFDQNRISLMAGYKFNKHFRAEAGYINQTVQLGREITNKNMIQYNNGFIINTYVNLN